MGMFEAVGWRAGVKELEVEEMPKGLREAVERFGGGKIWSPGKESVTEGLIGEVVSVGSGEAEGQELGLSVGDVVLCARDGLTVVVGGEEVVYVRKGSVLAKWNEGEG